MRGEFRFTGGLVLPNNIMTVGLQWILGQAFRNTDTNGTNLYVGLCEAVPNLALDLNDIVEPTIGVNGYERQLLAQGTTAWPTQGVSNNEPYVETEAIVFAPELTGFDQGITRMFLCFSETNVTGPVFALSAALPEPVILTPSNIDDYNFKYRIYN